MNVSSQSLNWKRVTLSAATLLGSLSIATAPIQALKPIYVDVHPQRREVDLTTWLPRNFIWEETAKNPLIKGNYELRELIINLLGFNRFSQSFGKIHLHSRDPIQDIDILMNLIIQGGTIGIWACEEDSSDRCVDPRFKTITLDPKKSLMALSEKQWKAYWTQKKPNPVSSAFMGAVSFPITEVTQEFNDLLKMSEKPQDPKTLAALALYGLAENLIMEAALEISATVGDQAAEEFKKSVKPNFRVLEKLTVPYVREAVTSVRSPEEMDALRRAAKERS